MSLLDSLAQYGDDLSSSSDSEDSEDSTQYLRPPKRKEEDNEPIEEQNEAQRENPRLPSDPFKNFKRPDFLEKRNPAAPVYTQELQTGGSGLFGTPKHLNPQLSDQRHYNFYQPTQRPKPRTSHHQQEKSGGKYSAVPAPDSDTAARAAADVAQLEAAALETASAADREEAAQNLDAYIRALERDKASLRKRPPERFSQKEKRKRASGQGSSEKSYAEDEKRILRQSFE
eukprot:gnl/Trimastix_PCT/3040.p1 GENE.gnl/Trimastix_PCT/3040~~gnl/Trimastix_PCT/3040.p1  ORF type:complete len:229 (+),score=28.42 gnl/Trimastix_PCT/3040:21-707(+)